MKFLITSGILSSLIAAAISLFKINNDSNILYRNIAKEKLSLVNLLLFELTTEDINIGPLIKEKGYLLSPDIFEPIVIFINTSKSKNSIKYETFKDYILEKLRKEKSMLERMYNKGFEEKKNKIFKSKEFLITETISDFSVMVFKFSVFISFFIFFYFSATSNVNENKFEVYFFSLLLLFYSVIMILGAIRIISSNFLMPIISNRKEKKDLYSPEGVVKKSGKYRCSICQNEITRFKGTIFPYCSHSGNVKLKNEFISFYWKFSGDVEDF